VQMMLKDPDSAEEQPGVLHLCNICGDHFYYDAGRMLIIYGELANSPAGKLSLAFSTDQGQTWKKSDLTFPDEKYATSLVAPQAPVFFNEKDGVLPFGLVGSNPDGSQGTNVLGVYTTSDGGKTWLTNPDVLEDAGKPGVSLQVLSPQEIISACGKGLCVTQDSGRTWQKIESNLSFNYDSDTLPYVTQFHFINDQVGWAHTDQGGQPGLWRTLDGGKNWKEIQPVLIQ